MAVIDGRETEEEELSMFAKIMIWVGAGGLVLFLASSWYQKRKRDRALSGDDK